MEVMWESGISGYMRNDLDCGGKFFFPRSHNGCHDLQLLLSVKRNQTS